MSFSTAGSGNVVTSVTKSGTSVTVTKGLTAVSEGDVRLTNDRPNPYSLTFSGYSDATYDGSTAVNVALPTKLSQLTNDSGYLTSIDADLVAIAALTGTTGLLRKTAANAWSLDINEYLTAITKAQVEGVLTGNIATHTHSQYLTAITKAQVEGVLTGNIATHTHSQYLTAITKAQVEAVLTGSITTHTHSQYLTGNQTITVSGDATGSGTTAISLTLANSGVGAGTYNNSATQVRPFTVDAKGRVTGIGTGVTITPAWGSITGTPDTLSGYGIIDGLPISIYTAHKNNQYPEKHVTIYDLNVLSHLSIVNGELQADIDFYSTGKVSASNGIFSNLTDGFIPYHQNDTNGLINSPLYVSGSNIGINYTSSFNHNLVVGGSSYQSSIALYSLSGSGTADTRNWVIKTNTATYGSFSIQQSVYKDGNPSSLGIDRLFINISGSVGIGTVTPGDYKLNVNQSLAGTNGIYVTAPGYGIRSISGDTSIYGSGANIGVYGTSTNLGVYGTSGNTGVEGNGSAYGVKGTGNSAGVLGQGSSAPSSIGVIASGSGYDFYASTPNGKSFFNGKILLGSTSGWALSGSNAGLHIISGSVIMGGFTPSGFYSNGEVTAYSTGTGAYGLTLMADMNANGHSVYNATNLQAGIAIIGNDPLGLIDGLSPGLYNADSDGIIAVYDQSNERFLYGNGWLTVNPFNGQVTAPSFKLGSWSFAESSGDLLFKYNGVTKAKLSSNGGFYMADSIYDYRTF